jgi:hypothetical protein
MLPHGNARKHSAASIRAMLEHFNWELFDHLPYSPDLAPSDYHLFTLLKEWCGPLRLNNNEELMEGIKTWLISQASIPAVTTLRSSLNMYVFFAYKNIFCHCLFY